MVRKLAVILAWMVETSEAYEGKTNADVEKEILDEMPVIPYVADVEKVTVVDVDKSWEGGENKK